MAKWACWRHDSSLGNSGEIFTNMAYEICVNKQDHNPEIYIELLFQKYFALCIPNVKIENIHSFKDLDPNMDLDNLHTKVEQYRYLLSDIYMPDVYFRGLPLYYPSVWENLSQEKVGYLHFPYHYYANKFDLPKEAIVIQFRQYGTHYNRVDGNCCEMQRFVDPQRFVEIALHYAELGFKVVKIGDPKQIAFPQHKNILDFGLFQHPDKTILDDLFMIDNCKVFISCDSGIWPMAGGMRKPLVLTNVTSVFHNMILDKPCITSWMDPACTKVLNKRIDKGTFCDNTVEEIYKAVSKLI